MKRLGRQVGDSAGLRPWVAGTPLAAWCLAIFVFSSVPGNKYPEVQWEHADKVMHVLLYFWVGVFAWVYFKSRGSGSISALVFGALYGLSDEVHQIWVPRRTFSLYDWAADSIGVIIGILVILALHRRHSSAENNNTKNNSESVERMEAS